MNNVDIKQVSKVGPGTVWIIEFAFTSPNKLINRMPIFLFY
jgi:hypothetical protein